jgi:hypothetical protein
MVELVLAKDRVGVRFPLPAPKKAPHPKGWGGFFLVSGIERAEVRRDIAFIVVEPNVDGRERAQRPALPCSSIPPTCSRKRTRLVRVFFL